jgi:transcriptional regulator with XRE-family HTH domain
MEYFQIKIKELRKTKGLSQKDLSDDLGIGATTISAWECGKNFPNQEILHKVAKYFDTDMNNLFGYISNAEIAFKQGLKALHLDAYRALPETEKEFIADQFNALISFAQKSKEPKFIPQRYADNGLNTESKI